MKSFIGFVLFCGFMFYAGAIHKLESPSVITTSTVLFGVDIGPGKSYQVTGKTTVLNALLSDSALNATIKGQKVSEKSLVAAFETFGYTDVKCVAL